MIGTFLLTNKKSGDQGDAALSMVGNEGGFVKHLFLAVMLDDLCANGIRSELRYISVMNPCRKVWQVAVQMYAQFCCVEKHAGGHDETAD